MRDIALSMLILGLLPLIIVQPYIGVLAWSWLGYMNPHRLTYGFAYSLPWVQIVALLTLAGMFYAREKWAPPSSAITWLIAAFLFWTAVTTLFAFSGDAAWPSFEKFVKIQAMILATLVLVRGQTKIHWLVVVIAFSIGFYGIKGGIFTILTGGGNRVLGPAGSFITDNNALALALCIVLPLFRYLHLQATHRWSRMGFMLCMVLITLAVLATYSRGGMLGLAAVGMFLLLKSRKRAGFLIVALLAVPLLLSVMPDKWASRMNTITDYQTEGSAVSRIETWRFAVNLGLDRPARGGGFGASTNSTIFWRYAPPNASKPRAVHSIFFQVLAEHGFVGLGLFLALLIAGWRSCNAIRRQTFEDPEKKWAYDLASMLQVSLVAYAVAGAFLPLPYFDLIYQLLAIIALVRVQFVAEPVAAKSRRAARPNVEALS
ncbi:putative O-glycosylation ligase, exosortase system type 1-associated protein [Salinisphaera dokdonensis CL-ES53]|uniref:O-glycosylation ligase, exosortase system type 1-associated protein n=1 Tax=Salinisphaera dokdonensis CL-ES53 TaxID=1304272 RepID=A0ABV2B466_9GAMM